MKINKVFSSNGVRVENTSLEALQENKDKSSAVTQAVDRPSITKLQNTYKTTFSAQEDISVMQQKISVLTQYNSTGNSQSITQATYNENPLFTEKEQSAILNQKNDVSSIIQQYEGDLNRMRTSLNKKLVSSSNSTAIYNEKDINNLIDSLNESMPSELKASSSVNIIDLLK